MEDGSEGGFWSVIGRLFRARSDASLEELIAEARREGEVKTEDASMLLNVLRLGEKKVLDIMVPRTDIVCAEREDPIPEVCDLIVAHGHSRIPVYRENKDHIVGIVHAKDLLRALLRPGEELTLDDLLREPFFIPETKNLKEMLVQFQNSKNHLAIAIDEYGGTSGLVTFEDVLEQIVGDIEDEYDVLRPDEVINVSGEDLLVTGRLSLDELRELVPLSLDSLQVETVGGYLSELAGRVPEPGESFLIEGREFLVRDADAKHVRTILIRPAPPASPEAGDHLLPAPGRDHSQDPES